MKKILSITMLFFLLIVINGCTKTDKTIEVLETDGYTNIEITGWKPFNCDEKDFFRTGFKAEKNGKEVKGVVCAGFFKGNTIRIK